MHIYTPRLFLSFASCAEGEECRRQRQPLQETRLLASPRPLTHSILPSFLPRLFLFGEFKFFSPVIIIAILCWRHEFQKYATRACTNAPRPTHSIVYRTTDEAAYKLTPLARVSSDTALIRSPINAQQARLRIKDTPQRFSSTLSVSPSLSLSLSLP